MFARRIFENARIEVVRGYLRSENCTKEVKCGKLTNNNQKITKSCPIFRRYDNLRFICEISNFICARLLEVREFRRGQILDIFAFLRIINQNDVIAGFQKICFHGGQRSESYKKGSHETVKLRKIETTQILSNF